MFKKILLATDGSGPSNKAARYVLEMLKDDPKAKATIISVNEVGHQMTYYAKMLSPDMEAAVDEMAKRRLETVLDIFRAEDIEVDTAFLQGDPAQMITKFAAENDFDVIVMGTTGASNIAGLLFGSVARKTVSLSKVPVLMIQTSV